MYRSVGGRCQTGVGWRMTGRWDMKPVEVGDSGRLAVKGWDFPFGPAVWSWICLCGPEVELPRVRYKNYSWGTCLGCKTRSGLQQCERGFWNLRLLSSPRKSVRNSEKAQKQRTWKHADVYGSQRKWSLTREGWVTVRVVGGQPGALCWEPEKSQDVQDAAYISEKDEKQTFGFHLWMSFKTLVRGISVQHSI